MKTQLTGIVALLAAATASSAQPSVHVGPFISSPTYFNGFEGIGADQYSALSYSEGGISISYVGRPAPHSRLIGPDYETGDIWTTWTTHIGGEGNSGWYGPGFGYTAVTLTNGANIQSIQFLAGSGWGYPYTFMQYELLNDGSLVTSGMVPLLTGNCSTAGWGRGEGCSTGTMSYVGFSGGGFDEVHLQNLGIPPTSFNPTEFEAGAFDSFAAVDEESSATPEPSALTMLLLGCFLLCFTGNVSGALLRSTRH